MIDIEAEELRQREFARLAAFVVPTLESLRSLAPTPFRAEVAQMLERFGHEIVTDESAARLLTVKDGKKFLVVCASPAIPDPTPSRDLARLHDAVVAANAAAGFFITTRGFTSEARAYAATAPLKLVDGEQLVASMGRSRGSGPLPDTYAAMCRQCGEIVMHRLDRAEAIPCGKGHLVPPTIAQAALVAPKRSEGAAGDEAPRKQFSRSEIRTHNARYRARVRSGLKPKT